MRLPDPKGSLSQRIPPSTIASANQEIRQIVAQQQGSKGPYNKYSAKEKATIGKYALEYGVITAKRKFSKQFNININESTVRSFKTRYLKERRRRREEHEDDDCVEELPERKRGRKLLLGNKMDDMVQSYVCKLREKGCVIKTAIVKAAARGLLMSQDRTRLQEFGGPATLTSAWVKSLLERMNFIQRHGTTKARVNVEEFREIKSSFLQEIITVVEMEY